MKKILITLFLSIQILFSFSQSVENKGLNMVVKNVSVITMSSETILKNQDVVIENGKVSAISTTKKSDYKGLLAIDGKHKYLMPSLADAHVHFPQTEAEMERIMKLYLINGVTKLRSMRGDWDHSDWKHKYNADYAMYPKFYLSPPPMSRNYDLSVSDMDQYFKTAKHYQFDFVKILSIKDAAAFSKFDSISKHYNVPISGHFPGNISDDLIFNSNYNAFEHLGGLTESSDIVADRLQLIKDKNLFICPTLSWYNVGSGRYSYDELRDLPGMEFVSKTIVDQWIEQTKQYREKLGNEAYQKEVADELKVLRMKYQVIEKANALGIPMLLSPDSSSKYMIPGFDMVGEMELLKNANLSNFDILKMATVNFAAFFKEDYGAIEIGKNADFILLDANPLENLDTLKKIDGLYFNNQFLDSKTLENMRQELLEMAHN